MSQAGRTEEDEGLQDSEGRRTLRKIAFRLLPLIGAGYTLAFIDRVNISFAALQMNRDLHFSETIYSTGAGLFFVGYALCEVPSNLMLLRVGARKWLTRIMFTWGLLAAAMMFVRTPLEFFTLRFLLGVAEAGFFPGVIYYLTLWFPSTVRARAISSFYIAPALSSVVMGSLAGLLLGLGGRFGLAGWQWLFLVEGIPAVLFSVVLFALLPDSPDRARWMSHKETVWLEGILDRERKAAVLDQHASALAALRLPKVWMIGGFFFCAQLAINAYTFSAPAMLRAATGWSVTNVGFLIAGFGICGALAMILNSAHSDRASERSWHAIVPCLVMGLGFTGASFGRFPLWMVSMLGICFVAYNALQVPALVLPTQFLAGRAAATGIAAMNSITMLSGFVGPYWMGMMKDATGSYQAGLRGMVLPCLCSAGLMFLLTRSLGSRSSEASNCKGAHSQ